MSSINNVQNLLDSKKIYYMEKGKDFLIKCVNPEHDDDHPSMRVDRETGKFGCFSCGFGGNIFEHFGEYVAPVYDLRFTVQQNLNKILRETRGLEIPDSAYPFREEFREIKAETYERFNAFLCADRFEENRIVFPIYDATGMIRCFNARHMHSDATPKYKMFPVEADIPLYPTPMNTSYVILVEGLFDMINLYDKGIDNVSCIFGAYNISYKTVQEKLMPFLMSGVRTFYVLLDNDKAGRYGAAKLVDIINNKTDANAVEICKMLPQGADPGSLDQEEADALANELKKLIAN